MIKYLAAMYAAIALSSAANAAPVKYNVTGSFSNGSTLTGSFSFDGTKTGAAQFSDVNVVVPGYFGWDRVYGNNVGQYDAADEYAYFWAGRSGDYIRLVFPTTTIAGITAIIGTQLSTGTYTYYYYSNTYLTSGAILPAVPVVPAVAAVPEPASWALMIAGFGAVGFAMRRRRKVATRVRFA